MLPPPPRGEGGVAGADYPLPAGVMDCSSSSLKDDVDVLSEEDEESLPSSLSSLEEASLSVDAILMTG
jgi:hypothetical protein